MWRTQGSSARSVFKLQTRVYMRVMLAARQVHKVRAAILLGLRRLRFRRMHRMLDRVASKSCPRFRFSGGVAMTRRKRAHPNAVWRRRLLVARREGFAAGIAIYRTGEHFHNPYENKFDADNYALHLAWCSGFVDGTYTEKRRRFPLDHPDRVRRVEVSP